MFILKKNETIVHFDDRITVYMSLCFCRRCGQWFIRLKSDRDRECWKSNVESEQASDNESTNQTETEEVKPWENVYISDEDAVNEKLLYYKKLPDQKKSLVKEDL